MLEKRVSRGAAEAAVLGNAGEAMARSVRRQEGDRGVRGAHPLQNTRQTLVSPAAGAPGREYIRTIRQSQDALEHFRGGFAKRPQARASLGVSKGQERIAEVAFRALEIDDFARPRARESEEGGRATSLGGRATSLGGGEGAPERSILRRVKTQLALLIGGQDDPSRRIVRPISLGDSISQDRSEKRHSPRRRPLAAGHRSASDSRNGTLPRNHVGTKTRRSPVVRSFTVRSPI